VNFLWGEEREGGREGGREGRGGAEWDGGHGLQEYKSSLSYNYFEH